MDLQYAPQTGDVTVSAGQHPPMVHHVGPLVAAPATVAIGENYADMGLTARKFGGKIEVLQKNVN